MNRLLVHKAYNLFTRSLKILLNFLYPAICLHCEDELEKPSQTLCRECLKQIEWLERGCIYCSAPIENGRICEKCSKHPLYLQPHASLFPSLGPISCLHTDFLRTKRADTLAAFVILGLSHLSFPMPNCIVPLLQPRCKGFVLKKQSAALLAQRVAAFLRCPTYFPSNKVEGRVVLFVTDWLDDAKELYSQRRKLNQFFPKQIYSIALIDARKHLSRYNPECALSMYGGNHFNCLH